MPPAVRKPGTRAPQAPRTAAEMKMVRGADGAIGNPKLERYALFLVDDVPGPDAWRAIGKRNEGGSMAYRRVVESHPVFQARLADLKAEKERLMTDELFGETKWMAAQMWREARCTANSTMMQKAAEFRMKIMEREVALAEKDGGSLPGKPGKPSIENPQTVAAVDDLKSRLIAAGVPAPGTKAAPSATPVVESQPAVAFSQAEPDLDAMLARVG